MEVIVLAGGLGTRLRSVVHEIPKCLAPVAGRPFLGYLLDCLVAQGVDHVVFSVGYLKEQVISFVQSKDWPFTYDFAVEDTPLGTGGGIRLALGLCQQDHVFVINGDTFYPVDLTNIPTDRPITLALKPMKDFDRYGAVSVQAASAGLTASENYFSESFPKNQFSAAIANPTHADAGFPKNQFSSAIANPTHAGAYLITEFHEKRHCEEGLINGGVYVIDRKRVDLSGLPEKFSFEKEVLEVGAAIGQIGGWVSDAYFIDIGVPEDYAKAQWAIPAWKAVQEASKAVLKADAATLFLDRDGVLNRHLPGDYVKNWGEWEWMPGVLQEMPRWAAKYERIVLVSNQRGVGKGVMTDEDLARVHAQMMADILAVGGRIDLVLTCTAVSDEDPRRKPNVGMYLEACSLLPGIDAKSSVMLGDTQTDAAFAANCGMQFILLNPEGVS